MSKNLEKLVEELSTLSIVEMAELQKKLEEKWGITAAMPVAAAGGAVGVGQAEVEEKTEFKVEVTEFSPDIKIKLVKIAKDTGLSLKESSDLFSKGAPVVVKEGIGKEDANKLKADLEAAGAKVVLK